jgi:hypothetical protein
MRITGSAVSMTSTQARLERYTRHEELRVWKPRPAKVEQPVPPKPAKGGEEEEVGPIRDLKLQVLLALLERLTGYRIDFLDAEDLQPEVEPIQLPDPRQGGGSVYTRTEEYVESEETRFQARAIIQTAGGEQREVQVSLDLRHVERWSQHLEIRTGVAPKDPLVLTFNGEAAQLDGESFDFDLDLDGVMEAMPELRQGAAWLVHDRDGDGQVKDGSELFGPKSGDGFAELQAGDDDGNGWIDEGDRIWAHLGLWERKGDGSRQLVGLAARGVGAISVMRAATPFTLRAGGEERGKLHSSGLWVGEEGGAGLVQRLDIIA